MRSSLLAALLLTSACGFRHYVTPAGDLGDFTKVSVRNLGTTNLSTLTYDDPFTCTGRVHFPPPGGNLPPLEFTSFHARKGELTTVTGEYREVYGGKIRWCTINVSFVPRHGEYAVLFEGNETACRAGAIEGGAQGARVPPEQLVLRRADVPWFPTGSWCKGFTPEQLAQLRALGVQPPASRDAPASGR